MQTFQQQRNYKKLEQLPRQVSELASLKLRRIWQSFVDFWHSPLGEPRVRQRTDRFGNLYWRVYDPANDRAIRFDDEQKLTIWLDERLYLKSKPNPWNID